MTCPPVVSRVSSAFASLGTWLVLLLPAHAGDTPDLTATFHQLREISFDPAAGPDAAAPVTASLRELFDSWSPEQLPADELVRLFSWDAVSRDPECLALGRPALESIVDGAGRAAPGAASVLLLVDLRAANERLMTAANSGDPAQLEQAAQALPDQVARTRAILAMPGFDAAVNAGLMSTFFRGMANFSLRGARETLLVDVPPLQRFLTEELPLTTLMDMFGLVHMSIQGVHAGQLEASQVAPLKARFVAALEATKRAGDLLPGETMWCEQVEQFLRSSWAQGGSLVGSPAADLGFAWSSDGALTSLADLRGRVVVLDFWATWCTGCRLAFPRLAALRERYADADVTILGVTSHQGQVPTDTGWVSTEGDRDAEQQHMARFMEAEGMTWPVVFSEVSVFDPRFEVHALPHLAVIAPDGTILGNGVAEQDLPALIDAALARRSE